MPKDFTIEDAIRGGDDSMPNYVMSILLVVGLIVVLYIIWAKTEHATNSNSSVGLQEFSAGTVGSETSAPLDLYNSSVYARNLQDVNQFAYNQIDPAAKPGDPGSAAWYVLHSDIMQCGKQDDISPWKWLRTDTDGKVVESHPAVIAAKQAVLATNPAASPVAVESHPTVVATKQAVADAAAVVAANPIPDSALAAKPVIPAEATPTVAIMAAGTPAKSESFMVGDKCPSVGVRIEDYKLTQSLMGY